MVASVLIPNLKYLLQASRHELSLYINPVTLNIVSRIEKVS